MQVLFSKNRNFFSNSAENVAEMLKNRKRFIRVYKGRRRKTISEEAGKNENG